MTARVVLKLDGELDQLRLAWQSMETMLSNVPFETEDEDPQSQRYNILLAMQELLTNVYRHGYGEAHAGGEVELMISVDPSRFVFEIWDRAPAFDPTSCGVDARREETPDGIPPTEGGYGLVIVRAVMDSLDYSFVDGRNVVRATKFVQSPVMASETGPSLA